MSENQFHCTRLYVQVCYREKRGKEREGKRLFCPMIEFTIVLKCFRQIAAPVLSLCQLLKKKKDSLDFFTDDEGVLGIV